MGGFAWVTLATNDSYSLGALVLGHSLRRAGTPHDLVALVTPGVSAAMRSQLSTVFTVVQEVNVLDSRDTANLALMSRPELGITFTKLHCWRLTQYEKCVFLDADTLVLKNCDELFDREELSAAPDPGWPDCFNSGVFVYRPSQDTYDALIKFAVVKGSFDGGDQGLLNLFFSDWSTKDISKHLPFIYNMVSSATYSYLPAYKQYGEGAKIAHFIGANKPWLQYFDSETRLVRPPQGSEHLQSLLQLWWDIFCSTVHPSLSPEMADSSTFENRAYMPTPTVSHFIFDLFQNFQPMSVYSEYQPISTTPYNEDPSIGFWDPWEHYAEQPSGSAPQHSTLLEYYGSRQQLTAFANDARQSGWKRHKTNNEQVQHSSNKFHNEEHHHHDHHDHHEPHEHYHHHQSQHYSDHNHHEHQLHHDHNHHESQHRHQQKPEPYHHHYHQHHEHQLHRHEIQQHQQHHHEHQNQHEHQHQHHYHHPHEHQHHHHEHQHQQHHHEHQHQQHHHEHQHQQHHHEHQHQQHHHEHNQQQHHHELQHQQQHHHEHQHQQQHHHEHQHQQQHHHEHQHQQQHHHEHQQQQHHHEHQHYQHEHKLEHHHYVPQHNNETYNHHEHQEYHNHQETHKNHHSEHNKQHRDEVPQIEDHGDYHIYNLPPPQWDSDKHKVEEQNHRHPIPQHYSPPSDISSSTNNQYVKVANETECLVTQPHKDVNQSTTENDLGLAGALAQLTLGVPRSAEQTALEEHMRKQAWEHGSMDYMGRDSFDNIWRKIEETLAEAPSKPEAQKPATAEVPPTESVPDSTLPEPKPSKTPTDTSETTGLSSLRFESTSSTQETKAPPPLAETVALGQDSAKPMSDIPNTPSVTEATPPTSPPVVPHTAPIADIQALKVDAPPPETPPVGSEPVKLVANTEHIESLKVAEQPKTKQEGTSPETVTHITQEPVPLQPSSEAGGLGSPLLGKTSGNEPLKSAVSSETESSHSPEVPVLTEAAPPSKIPETLTDEAKSATSLHQVSPSTQETSVVTEVKSVAVPQPVSKVESPAPLTSIETSQPTTTKSVPEAKTETLPQPVSEIEPVKQQEPPAPLISIEISQSTTTKSVPEAKTETLPQPVSKIEPVKQQEPSAPLTSIETSKPTTTKSVPEANIETVPQVAEKDKSKSLESTAAVKPKVQSKPEEASKALPKSSGSTPPSTPDAPPSEQAPIPPKRRGHKAGGSAHAAEQGAASKPTSHAQHQQPKGSKPSQKGKK